MLHLKEMGRMTEMRKRAKIEELSRVTIQYLEQHGFATRRELSTILPQKIGLREISSGMIDEVIENVKWRITPSGRIVVVTEREHRRPYLIMGVVDLHPLYITSGTCLGASRTYTGTLCSP